MTDAIDQALATAIVDRVPGDAPGALEIGFEIAERYNASEILFDNLRAGRADKIAIHAATGSTSYGELCAKAAQCGNALASLGLRRGDRGIAAHQGLELLLLRRSRGLGGGRHGSSLT